mmetsp:Transcript_94966/g.268231  ORF Transcript_94966/g.268231 Transcript_94966/m.268231 type:complete len:301 (-) Transcript_94966:1450-2352(-)
MFWVWKANRRHRRYLSVQINVRVGHSPAHRYHRDKLQGLLRMELRQLRLSPTDLSLQKPSSAGVCHRGIVQRLSYALDPGPRLRDLLVELQKHGTPLSLHFPRQWRRHDPERDQSRSPGKYISARCSRRAGARSWRTLGFVARAGGSLVVVTRGGSNLPTEPCNVAGTQEHRLVATVAPPAPGPIGADNNCPPRRDAKDAARLEGARLDPVAGENGLAPHLEVRCEADVAVADCHNNDVVPRVHLQRPHWPNLAKGCSLRLRQDHGGVLLGGHRGHRQRLGARRATHGGHVGRHARDAEG